MKKNFNKIPDILLSQANSSSEILFIVATTIEASKNELLEGRFKDIGISFAEGDELRIEEEIYPLSEKGRYSKRNREGKFRTRRDLPKITKQYYLGERPIFGDYSKGSFSMYVTKQVYQKDFLPPEELIIKIELIKTIELENDCKYFFKVTVDQVLNKTLDDFNDKLLFGLNLLQENVGKSDLFEFSSGNDDYLRALNIGWELLPVGDREMLDAILTGPGGSTLSTLQRETIQDRYEFLSSLNPLHLIKGLSGMRRYYGAKFADNLVVLENLDYGNAIYVMFDNWEELSKQSRTELLSKTTRDFERIKHNGTGWKIKLKMIIENRLSAN